MILRGSELRKRTAEANCGSLRLLLLLVLILFTMPFSLNAQRSGNVGECGVYTHTSPPEIPEEDKVVADRFGNLYAPYELLVSAMGPGDCDCSDFGTDYETDYFQLFFVDCLESANEGFDLQDINPNTGNLWGDDYKKVLCRVFHDLSDLITPYDPVANVKIKIDRVTATDQVPAGVLGVGGSWHDNAAEGGVMYGRVWKAINGTPELPPFDDYYDGFVKISFLLTDVNPYRVDPTVSINLDEYDLYTVAYHEALHALDFASLMNSDGTPSLAGGISYSRFATHLELDNGNDIITNVSPPSYFWSLNTPSVSTGDLHLSCLDTGSDTSGPDMLWVHSPTESYPVFTGEAGNPSGFSHFAHECDGATVEYLMRPDFGLQQEAVIHEHEKQVLCDLGYNVSGISCSPCSIFGQDDDISNTPGMPNFELCPGGNNNFQLSIAELIANDINADDIILLEQTGTIGNINLNSVSINPVAGQSGLYEVTYFVPGIYRLKYIPVSNSCSEQGNVTFVDFQVTSCLSQCLYSNGNELNCTDYDNTCNLVCNPEFCSEAPETNILLNVEVPGWATGFDTPDWYLEDGNSFMHIINVNLLSPLVQTDESVYSLNNIGGGNYFYSVYHSSVKPNVFHPDVYLKIALIKDDLLDQILDIEAASDGFLNNNSELDINTNNYFELMSAFSPIVVSNPSDNFTRSSGCIEMPSSFISDAIWVFNEREVFEDEANISTYFDQLEIVQDDFFAGVDNPGIVCGTSAILGGNDFCMLSDIWVYYYWTDSDIPNPDISDALLTYRVRNNSDGSSEIFLLQNGWQQVNEIPTLTVSPETTTCYRLNRLALSIDNLEFCNDYDEVCINVTGTAYNAAFDVENCAGLTITLVPVDNQNPQSWDLGDGTTISSNGENVNHTYSQPGNYTIIHTVGATCPVTYQTVVSLPDCADACCPAGATALSNVSISTSGLPVNETGETICISGILTIDQNYTFTGEIIMNTNAQIVVENGVTLTLDGANVHGCEFLWQGITTSVNSNAKIVCVNSSVQDAKTAIYTLSSPNLIVQNSVFDNNYIGLDLRSGDFGDCYGNTFDCTGNLLPDYDNIITGQKTYVGIRATGDTKRIGVDGQNPNIFQNIRNGIFYNRYNLIVRNSQFINIVSDQNDDYDVMGVGIFHFNAMYLDQQGYGKNPATDTPTFTNCETAIRTNNGGDIDIRDNNMRNVRTGIKIRFSQNRNIYIDHNYIEATSRAIYLLHNDPALSLNVSFNDIDLIGLKAFGITVEEMSNPHPQAIIEENIIYGIGNGLENGVIQGIYLNNPNNIAVKTNRIYLNTTNPIGGITIRNGFDCSLDCNRIYGFGVNSSSGVGIDIRSTLQTQYNCNYLSNLHTGMKFTGVCDIIEDTDENSKSYIKGTTFVPPFVTGLHYTASTIINSQIHKGNKWMGIDTDYGDKAARHDGMNLDDITNAAYEVHTTSPPYHPPSVFAVTQWFVVDPTGTPEGCGPNDCPIVFINAPQIGDLAIRVATGQNLSNVYPATELWTAQRVLHKSLKDNSGLLGQDASVDSFYNTAEANEIGAFYGIGKGTSAAWTSSTAELDQIKTLSQQLALNLENLVTKDMAIAQSSTPVLLTERDGLLQTIKTQTDDLTALFAIVNADRNTQVTTLTANNSNILTNAVYESNEKEVNDIYLSTLGQGLSEFTITQQLSLYSIAQQCPLQGGNAVFKARALYSLTDDDMVYDDDALCGSSSALVQAVGNDKMESLDLDKSKDTDSKTTPEFRLYPNPVKNLMTLDYSLEKQGQVVVYDMYGRAIIQKVLLPDNTRIYLNTENIANGLYLLKVFDDEAEHFSSKIIIQN